MDKTERDEIEQAALAANSESWCLHPNGTSVWTGEEYGSDVPQDLVCKAPIPLELVDARRMQFIAACSPFQVLELLEFYGLSDTRLERGQEDSEEVCVSCGYATTEGHTHAECFANGKSDGAVEENLRLAASVSAVLDREPEGYFDASLKQIVELRSDAFTLARVIYDEKGLLQRMSDAERQALIRVLAIKALP